MRLFAISLLLLVCCGAFKARLKTAVTETPISARATTAGACDAFPFDKTYTYAELTGGQARELGPALKVCDFPWRIEARLDALAGDSGCATPAGSVALSSFTLEYANDEGILQQHVVDCPITRLSFESAEILSDVVNGCFKSLVAQQGEAVKVALSTKEKKLRIYANSSCAADGCFSAEWTIVTVVPDGLVSIGDCPK